MVYIAVICFSFIDLSSTYINKRRMLVDQVKLLQAADIDVELVYHTNAIYDLKDCKEV